jgi:hypothetical protein
MRRTIRALMITTSSSAMKKKLGNTSTTSRRKSFGFGWLNKEMATWSGSVDLSSRKFGTAPRPYDRRPSDVPAQHPVRAIAKVLHEARRILSSESIATPPCQTLLLWIESFITEGDKTVKIIMQNCERSINSIQDFWKRFEKVNSYDVFFFLLASRASRCEHKQTWMLAILFHA